VASLRVERTTSDRRPAQPRFVFDLVSAESWLVAERVLQDLPALAEWWPVYLPGAVDALPRDEVARRAVERGLLAVRWPPARSDTRRAMLAAVYAKQIGKTVAFCLAAFRQAYAGGRDPGADETFLLAGAAAEMHPAAIIRAIETRGVARALDEATALVEELGLRTLPAIVTPGGEVFTGDDGIEAAAVALAAPAT
jgi:2-hydroxychromene-2-carboxylate isomerase